LLCSDGFRHVVSEDEIFQEFNNIENNEIIMKDKIIKLVELNKQRLENDNITAIILHLDKNS
jgi:serine/threonine protein phosphatase PrpC